MDKFVLGFSRPEFGMLTSLWYFKVAHDQYPLELGILASRERLLIRIDSSMPRGFRYRLFD